MSKPNKSADMCGWDRGRTIWTLTTKYKCIKIGSTLFNCVMECHYKQSLARGLLLQTIFALFYIPTRMVHVWSKFSSAGTKKISNLVMTQNGS